MPQRIIITGAAGMVGEGVLLTCLAQPDVEAVLSISRRPSERTHPKLRELIIVPLNATKRPKPILDTSKLIKTKLLL